MVVNNLDATSGYGYGQSCVVWPVQRRWWCMPCTWSWISGYTATWSYSLWRFPWRNDTRRPVASPCRGMSCIPPPIYLQKNVFTEYLSMIKYLYTDKPPVILIPLEIKDEKASLKAFIWDALMFYLFYFNSKENLQLGSNNMIVCNLRWKEDFWGIAYPFRKKGVCLFLYCVCYGKITVYVIFLTNCI